MKTNANQNPSAMQSIVCLMSNRCVGTKPALHLSKERQWKTERLASWHNICTDRWVWRLLDYPVFISKITFHPIRFPSSSNHNLCFNRMFAGVLTKYIHFALINQGQDYTGFSFDYARVIDILLFVLLTLLTCFFPTPRLTHLIMILVGYWCSLDPLHRKGGLYK